MDGGGTHVEQGCADEVDVYCATFAKSMASTGGFIASNDKAIITHCRYNMRSQIYAKSMPLVNVMGALKRLELIRNHPEFREKLWENVRMLQNGLRERGFDIGDLTSCVTPVYMKGSLGRSHPRGCRHARELSYILLDSDTSSHPGRKYPIASDTYQLSHQERIFSTPWTLLHRYATNWPTNNM